MDIVRVEWATVLIFDNKYVIERETPRTIQKKMNVMVRSRDRLILAIKLLWLRPMCSLHKLVILEGPTT